MFNTFERMVAFRYLRARRKEGFISVITTFSILGITLGVATLIVVMAVMNGFKIELMDRILGINAHITVNSPHQNITDFDALTQTIRNIPDVATAAPLITGQVLAVANNNHTGVLVRGMLPEDLKRKTMVSDNIKVGDIEDFNGNNAVIIGSRLANYLKIMPGDIIRLISPKTTDTFFGAMPRLKDYTVVGIFEVGMYEYDSATIFMPLEAAQIYFKVPNAVNSIEVNVNNSENIPTNLAEIDRATDGKYLLTDWKDANREFMDTVEVERNVMFLILTLIILVAAFNIISGMVMLVTSKAKEVAILRTMGAYRSSIMRIFFMCGASVGFIGTVLGFLLGLGFASNIEEIRRFIENTFDTTLFPATVYFLTKLPADVQITDVISIVGMSLILSLLAPLYPAWRAAKMSPVEGLRYE